MQSQLGLNREFRPLEADLAVDELVVHKLDADLENVRRHLQLDAIARLLFFVVLTLAVLRLTLSHARVEGVRQVLGDHAHVLVDVEVLVIRPLNFIGNRYLRVELDVLGGFDELDRLGCFNCGHI